MISKVLQESQIGRANKLIERAERIVIICHERPDGDAVGSALGLCHLLSTIDKNTSIILPNAVPAFLEWLPGVDEAIVCEGNEEYARETVAQADLIFCLDFNAPYRAGAVLAQAIQESQACKIMLDHHPDPEDFCDVAFSHPEASSTGELVFRFICRSGYFEEIEEDCATALFTAIMLDTGNFAHNADSVDLYLIIAQLIQKGVKKSEVYERLFQSSRESKVRLWGYALYQNMVIDNVRNLAYMSLSKEELDRFEAIKGDTEGLVNEMLGIEGVCYAVFLREEEKGKINLSLRSKGEFPINAYARSYFNGGGHANAAGGRMEGSMSDAIIRLTTTFRINEQGQIITE